MSTALTRSLLVVVLSTAFLVSVAAPSQARPSCGGRPATIVGTAGDDTIRGTPGPDVIAALGGDDSVDARGGDDIVCGGAGSDWLVGGRGNDRLITGKGRFNALIGGSGNDRLEGGRGTGDLVELGLAKRAVTVDLGAGTITGEGNDTISGVETVFGSPFDDTLIGDEHANTLAGRWGNDTIVSGGGGNLECSTPQPGISSFACADILVGEGGDDTLTGGDGLDVVMYFDAPAPVTVDLAAGTATGEGSDSLEGIEGVSSSRNGDTLTGDAGDNVFALEGADDTVDGAGGTDLVFYTGSGVLFTAPGVTVDLAAGTATGQGEDTLIGIEDVWGSPGDDTLSGDGAANELRARGGDDTISGGAGDDLLDGGPGIDSLDGGSGYDACVGGETLTSCETT